MKKLYTLLSVLLLLSAPNLMAVDYISVQTGNWIDASVWNQPGNETDYTVAWPDVVTIDVDDTVYVTGNLEIELWGDLIVNGVLRVQGNVTNLADGDITINGTLLVDGDFTNWGFITSPTVGVGTDAYLGVTGDVFSGGAASFDNSGTVVAGGTIDGVTGTGSTASGAVDPLPIELISFTSVLDNNRVNFEWLTASETDNDYFTLEQSLNGLDWEAIATLPGAGTSTEVLTYTHEHFLFSTGYYYFRLKQTDFNGDFSHSDITAVQFEAAKVFKQAKAIVKSGQVNLVGDFNQVSVYDINGRKWGDYSSSFSASELPSNRVLIFVFDNAYSQKVLISSL